MEQKEIYNYELFEIKPIHLKLLQRSYWEYNECCEGSTGMNEKRPYGNSDPLDDICEELGIKRIETSGGDEVFLKEHFDQAQQIHFDMVIVMDIICKTLQISAGVYNNTTFKDKFEYSAKWVKQE